MKQNSFQFFFNVAILLIYVSEARVWEDVIRVSIFSESSIDINKVQFAIERNPLASSSDLPMDLLETMMPSDLPSMFPTIKPTKRMNPHSALRRFVTRPPVAGHSAPTEAPSPVPTSNKILKYEIDTNKTILKSITQSPTESLTELSTESDDFECPAGTIRYRLDMFDEWGDGWDSTTISIVEMEYRNHSYVTKESVERIDNGTENTTAPILKEESVSSGEEVTIQNSTVDNVIKYHTDYYEPKRSPNTSIHSNKKTGINMTNFELTRTTTNHENPNTTTITSTINMTHFNSIINESANNTMSRSRKLKNTTFTARLHSGPSASRHACLRTERCYNIIVKNGLWTEEVTWELRLEDGNRLIAQGREPEDCTFSITAVGTMDNYCPRTCSVELRNEIEMEFLRKSTAVDEITVSDAPSMMPSNVPSESKKTWGFSNRGRSSSWSSSSIGNARSSVNAARGNSH